MIKILFGLLVLSAQGTSAQTVVDISESNYEHTLNGWKWSVNVNDTSKYGKSGIPVPGKRSGTVVLEGRAKDAFLSQKIVIPNFPNEDGVILIHLQSRKEPLFLVVSRGDELKDEERRVHLVSPSCKNVIAHFDGALEDSTDLTVRASAKEFSVEFTGIDEKTVTKKWSLPEQPAKFCSNGFD